MARREFRGKAAQSKNWRGIDGAKAVDEVQLSRVFKIHLKGTECNMRGIWICSSSIYSEAALEPYDDPTVNGSSAHIESGSSAHIESRSSAHIERSSAHIDAGRVGVGYTNVPCTSLPLTCSLHPRLGQHGGVGVGWGSGGGGVGWGAITYLRSAHGLDVHFVSTSTYLLTASMSWSAWGGGGGVGWVGVQQCSFHITSTYLLTASTSWSAWWGGGGVGSLPLACSLHPRLGQHALCERTWGKLSERRTTEKEKEKAGTASLKTKTSHSDMTKSTTQ